jgi:hypothetical protein
MLATYRRAVRHHGFSPVLDELFTCGGDVWVRDVNFEELKVILAIVAVRLRVEVRKLINGERARCIHAYQQSI